ncbi:hypothetical protein RRG08_029175 [Elysia crispata]|uniref:Uncharacterized protein n=1 Tax=Elysia crispata TaxID=231223 RepID=A0AAE1AK80_9GAST|nr:hypothetical protein RRG08_029175 [Elysia crispata]
MWSALIDGISLPLRGVAYVTHGSKLLYSGPFVLLSSRLRSFPSGGARTILSKVQMVVETPKMTTCDPNKASVSVSVSADPLPDFSSHLK